MAVGETGHFERGEGPGDEVASPNPFLKATRGE